MSELITPEQRRQLRKNGAPDKHDLDHYPVVKLHIPVYRCVMLLTELDPKRSLQGYGLIDRGTGHPDIRSISIKSIQEHSEGLMWQLTQDTDFVARYPLSVYLCAAQRNRRYTEDEALLQAAADEICRIKAQLAVEAAEPEMNPAPEQTAPAPA